MRRMPLWLGACVRNFNFLAIQQKIHYYSNSNSNSNSNDDFI